MYLTIKLLSTNKMKIICLVKFLPDVENFQYDYEKNVLIRENVSLILNPDDAAALAFALKIKEREPETFIEVVSMAPKSVIPHLEDLIRRDVDKATLISDRLYVGSDSYITSKILARYLEKEKFDCIFTGTHTLDGDTSHVPSQVGELLDLTQLSGIVKIDEFLFSKDTAVVNVESEGIISAYQIDLPAILSLQKESKYKLPYIKYKDLERDVKEKIVVISNEDLEFEKNQVGIIGSLTKVSRTYIKKVDKKSKVIVRNDDYGIDVVYSFLKEQGFV